MYSPAVGASTTSGSTSAAAEPPVLSGCIIGAGMSDDAVLDKLVALGLRANTIAALSLVPLIAVAWADGTIQENERTAILQGAAGKGLESGTDGYDLLQTWLAKQPSSDLMDAWEAYNKALAIQRNDEQNPLGKNPNTRFPKMDAAVGGRNP